MADNLLKSTASVGSMTLISRILGFLRDIVTAQLFGASAGYDAFLVAFKIPNFFRSLFAEGAFSQAFVPLLSELQTNDEHAQARAFVNSISGCLALICLLATTIGILGAPWIITFFAPGFSDEPERFELAVTMIKITFPYLFFISMTALAGGILNTYNRYKVPAFTPVLLNVSLISFAILFSPYFAEPIEALAWGVFAGGILQLSFQLPFLWKIKLLPNPKPNFKHPMVKRLLKLMIPALFGVSIVQINLLMGTFFASFLPAGSVSWLYYADRLMQFPLGVFGVALATVVLPSLSKRFARQDEDDYRAVLSWSLGVALIISLPAVVGLYQLATPLMATLFKHGAFKADDALAASAALKAYAVGIMAFILIKVFAAAFYARQDIRTPVKASALGLLCNIFLSIILLSKLAHVGLALATSISAMGNAGLLGYLLYRKGLFEVSMTLGRVILRVLFAVTLMSLHLSLMQHMWPIDWFDATGLTRAMHLGLLVCSGALVYLLAIRLTGYRLRDLHYSPGGG